MTDLSPSELRTRLASEFDARGWEYDLVTGKAIAERAEKDGKIAPRPSRVRCRIPSCSAQEPPATT